MPYPSLGSRLVSTTHIVLELVPHHIGPQNGLPMPKSHCGVAGNLMASKHTCTLSTMNDFKSAMRGYSSPFPWWWTSGCGFSFLCNTCSFSMGQPCAKTSVPCSNIFAIISQWHWQACPTKWWTCWNRPHVSKYSTLFLYVVDAVLSIVSLEFFIQEAALQVKVDLTLVCENQPGTQQIRSGDCA